MSRVSLLPIGWLVLALFAAPPALAEGRDSLRKTRDLGAMVGLLDPYPSLLGLTVGWQTSSSLRLELGMGRQNLELSHVTTWAAGVKFFVPHWNLSPWASVHLAAVSHEGRDTIFGFSRTGSHAYAGFGLEWLTQSGFTASLGYHVSTKGNTLSMPMLSLGWFFSI